MAEEDRLWTELHDLVDALPRDKVEEPGYFEEAMVRQGPRGSYRELAGRGGRHPRADPLRDLPAGGDRHRRDERVVLQIDA